MKLRLITCRGGSGPGHWHVCRRPTNWGPALIVHERKDQADLLMDLRRYVLPPLGLAHALDLVAIYRVANWGDMTATASLIQISRVPTRVVQNVIVDVLDLAGTVEGLTPAPTQRMG